MAVAITTITDPEGNDWVLDGSMGVWEGPGKQGFHGLSYQHYRNESPAVSGAFWLGTRAEVRDLALPIVIRHFDRNGLLNTRRALAAALSPIHGECVIASAWPDGTTRRIKARYVDGLDAGAQGPGSYGVTVMKYVLHFVADDPYMYGDQIDSTWSLVPVARLELPQPGSDTFFEVVATSNITGGAVLLNEGDVDTYPTWRFTGPFSQIIASNNTNQQTWNISHVAASNTNWLELVTAPGVSSLVDETGTNQWSKLVAGYQLWPLARGENDVDITLVGADETSIATMSYTPLYEAD